MSNDEIKIKEAEVENIEENTPPHLPESSISEDDNDGKKKGSVSPSPSPSPSPSLLTLGLCVGALIVFGGIIMAVKSSKSPQSAKPAVSQAKADELQRLTKEAEAAIQQAKTLKDEIVAIQDMTPAEDSGLSRKYYDSPTPAELEPLDAYMSNQDRGRQEEEAINAVLRSAETGVPPDVSKQLAAAINETRNAESTNSISIPMFVYSKTYGGARYSDIERAQPANEESSNQQTMMQEEISSLRTLVQLMAVNPELAATSVMQEAVGGRDTPETEKKQTQLIYTNHPPVIVNEGEMFEAALVNRLIVNVEPSPVVATITRDVYDRSGQYVVFPANSRVIGSSQAVSYKGASRLFVSFQRIILPNGLSVDLPRSESFLRAMDAQGALGIVSHVNRHWFMQFGTAIMFGVIDGLAGWAQGGNNMMVTSEGYVISRTSQNFDKVLDRMMEQYSSIVPTITVNQGKTMRIYISDDMLISPWQTLKERSYYGTR